MPTLSTAPRCNHCGYLQVKLDTGESVEWPYMWWQVCAILSACPMLPLCLGEEGEGALLCGPSVHDRCASQVDLDQTEHQYGAMDAALSTPRRRSLLLRPMQV